MNNAAAASDDGQPRLPQRGSRRSIELTGHVLRGTGEIADITLHDLSYDGCRISTPSYLWQGEAIKLSIPRRGVINAEVRWCRDGFAGLVFEPEFIPEKVLTERAAERVPVRGEVTLRRLGISAFRVDVHDLNRFGCKIELVDRPRVSEIVLIKFDSLEALEARVQWIDGFIAGLKLDHPLHPAVFDILKLRLTGD